MSQDLKNIDGRSALDLCESVPKQQWQEVAKLLRDWKEIEKIQVIKLAERGEEKV